jgi:NAD(P) transhydrogenase
MVAAYHSLVGLAATVTSIATVMMANEGGHDADTVHNVTAFLGTLIGAVTLTGSGIAFGKLHGVMSSAPLALPGKNAINVGLLAGEHPGGHVASCWRWLLYCNASMMASAV